MDDKNPLWQKDSQHKKCNLCSTEFTFRVRRHHCRSCGVIVCDSCSSEKAPVHGYSSQERVCQTCYDQRSYQFKQREHKLIPAVKIVEAYRKRHQAAAKTERALYPKNRKILLLGRDEDQVLNFQKDFYFKEISGYEGMIAGVDFEAYDAFGRYKNLKDHLIVGCYRESMLSIVMSYLEDTVCVFILEDEEDRIPGRLLDAIKAQNLPFVKLFFNRRLRKIIPSLQKTDDGSINKVRSAYIEWMDDAYALSLVRDLHQKDDQLRQQIRNTVCPKLIEAISIKRKAALTEGQSLIEALPLLQRLSVRSEFISKADLNAVVKAVSDWSDLLLRYVEILFFPRGVWLSSKRRLSKDITAFRASENQRLIDDHIRSLSSSQVAFNYCYAKATRQRDEQIKHIFSGAIQHSERVSFMTSESLKRDALRLEYTDEFYARMSIEHERFQEIHCYQEQMKCEQRDIGQKRQRIFDDIMNLSCRASNEDLMKMVRYQPNQNLPMPTLATCVHFIVSYYHIPSELLPDKGPLFELLNQYPLVNSRVDGNIEMLLTNMANKSSGEATNSYLHSLIYYYACQWIVSAEGEQALKAQFLRNGANGLFYLDKVVPNIQLLNQKFSRSLQLPLHLDRQGRSTQTPDVFYLSTKAVAKLSLSIFNSLHSEDMVERYGLVVGLCFDARSESINNRYNSINSTQSVADVCNKLLGVITLYVSYAGRFNFHNDMFVLGEHHIVEKFSKAFLQKAFIAIYPEGVTAFDGQKNLTVKEDNVLSYMLQNHLVAEGELY